MTDPRLANYIRGHRADSGIFTHVSTLPPRGRYCFDRVKLELFWTYYCKLLHENKNVISGLAEMPNEYSMLVVDADIRSEKPMNLPVRLYTYDHVQKVVKAYQDMMKKLTPKIKPEHYTCILLEKDPYLDDHGFCKSGFHLAFINYFASKSELDIYLIPKVCEQVDTNKVFEDLGYAISSKVLDISKRNNKPKPWLMYGSCKNENAGAYFVSKAYTQGAVEIPVKQAFANYKIYDLSENEIKYQTDDIEYYYPRIFSVFPYGRPIIQIVGKSDNLGSSVGGEFNYSNDDEEEHEELNGKKLEQLLESVNELLGMLSVDRIEDHDQWLEIGWILYSIGFGSSKFLDLWADWSQLSDGKHDRSSARCVREWGKMYKGNFTIGSLKYFAKMDDPDRFKVYQEKKSDFFLNKAIFSTTHYDIARSLYELYSDVFVCASIEPKKVWLRYTNHHWQIMQGAIHLKKKISEDIVKKFSEIGSQLYAKKAELMGSGGDQNGEDCKNIETKLEAVNKISKSLGTNTFKNNIINECIELFYDEDFLNKLGKDKYLLCFKNGVYDLKNHVFRDGKPEDYIALQMPIDYIHHNDDDPWLLELHDFLEKVFTDRSLREYFIDIAAEYFIGGNSRKLVQIYNGSGNNAKTIMIQIFQEMMGPYTIEIPMNVLTGPPPRAGSAFPELDRAGDGARIIFGQETNKKEYMNLGTLKKLSGGDRFYVRGMYKDGREIVPMFKLVLACNNLPRLPAEDPAVWIRMRVIPFESTFCDDAPEDLDEQYKQKRFPIDRKFSEKIKDLIKPLAWFLIQRLKNRGDRKIIEPAKVLAATEHYRKDNDIFLQFIEEKIIPDEKCILYLNDLYATFKDWHKGARSGPIPDKREAAEYFENTWGNMLPGLRFNGYRLRVVKDDVESGKAVVPDGEYFDKKTSNNPGDIM